MPPQGELVPRVPAIFLGEPKPHLKAQTRIPVILRPSGSVLARMVHSRRARETGEGGKAKAAPLGLQAGEHLPLAAGTCALSDSPQERPEISPGFMGQEGRRWTHLGPARGPPHHRTGGAPSQPLR